MMQRVKIDEAFEATLEEMLEQGYVRAKKHAQADLWIYNYTPNAQFERLWNRVTLQCRGLILDADKRIVARPLPKFFNLEELEKDQLPRLPFEVYEKLDGSLGILYFLDGVPYIASRGSFDSRQARKANSLLYGKYRGSLNRLNEAHTYLFEIIYPENRIVVDYGAEEQLVLLAVIETATGGEKDLPDIGFPRAARYEWNTPIGKLKEWKQANHEGYIVRFSNGFRLKVKLERYLELHRIVTGISTKSIWESLSAGKDLKELLEVLPDEYYDWVKVEVRNLRAAYDAIEQQCKKDFRVLQDRKQTARYFSTCAHPSILFRMLDKREYADLIWRKLRPEFERPFQ